MIYTKDMKSLLSDSFADERRPLPKARLLLGAIGLGLLAFVVWVALSDPSVTTVRVVRPVAVPLSGDEP